MLDIPPKLVEGAREVGPEAQAWLGRVPGLVARAVDRWSLRLDSPWPARYSLVVPAHSADGSAVVLKLAIPDPETAWEAAALRVYDGRGAVRLLAVDDETGALLLERAAPGTPLADHDAGSFGRAGTLTTLAAALRRLTVELPPDHPFPTAAAQAARWVVELPTRRVAPFERPLVDRATTALVELAERLGDSGSAGPAYLLHRDLHHWNLLAAERESWLAIDPKPLAGEPARACPALLRNPWGRFDPHAEMGHRLDLLADELALDRERIRTWALAETVVFGTADALRLGPHHESVRWQHTCAQALATA